MEVRSGELVCLLGPNASGKTTLARALTGVLSFYNGSINRGTILLGDSPVSSRSPQEIVSMGIGLVVQGGRVFPSLTVRENLEIGGFLLNDALERDRRISEALDVFPTLSKLMDRVAKTLSGGERQLVAIARTFILSPNVYILDEPTAGLSPNFASLVINSILQICRNGASALLIEQNAQLAFQAMDRGYVLKEGRVVAEAPRDEKQRLESALSLEG